MPTRSPLLLGFKTHPGVTLSRFLNFTPDMATQKFPLDKLNQLRQYIQKILTIPDAEHPAQASTGGEDGEDVPEPSSIDALSDLFTLGGAATVDALPLYLQDQWFISTVNPASVLLKLPGLGLKPDFRLVSYLYRSEGSGVGLVWAVPESLSTTVHLEKALAASGGLSQPPKPEGALKSFMEAIEGDRSPASFVVASILRRELQEFGALGQRRNWSHHRLIDTLPAKANWEWRSEQPKDWMPKVKVAPDGQAIVEFFTCRLTNPITLFRHVDQYSADLYQPRSLDKGLAVANR